MSQKRTDLGRLKIGDSFQVQKEGRPYVIHDKVISNDNFDDERDIAFDTYPNAAHYVICFGPNGLCVYEQEKQVLKLNSV